MSAISGPFGRQAGARSRRLPTRFALRVVEHDMLVFRHGIVSYLVAGLANPYLYLLSMGIGLGVYVDRSGGDALGGISYLQYIAPALLISQAMMTAAWDSTHPIMSKFEWSKVYWAALNTPLAAIDLFAGELVWVAFRLTVVSALFLAIATAMGGIVSPLAVLAVPVAVLTGLAFAAPLIAFTATQKRDTAFNAIMRFGITPLFLFSGTFFPIERLPIVVQPLAWITPLYHGVSLGRSLALGSVEALPAAIHLAVLLLFIAIGIAWGIRTYRRRLEV